MTDKHTHPATDRLLRIDEIIGGDQPLIPLSRSGFYSAIRRGEISPPKKIGTASLWPLTQLRADIDALASAGEVGE